MTEFGRIYRKYLGKTLKDLVEEGDYASIRNTFLLQMVAFTMFGSVLGVELVRAGVIPL